MDAFSCLVTRRSVRRFTAQPVPRALVTELVEAAAFAPSWKNTQTTRYVAVDDPAMRERLAQQAMAGFAHNAAIVEGAPVLVLVTTVTGRSGFERDGSFSTPQGTHWQSFDAGMAVQTLCLAAHAKGLGSVVLGIFDSEAVEQLVPLPQGQTLAALVALGWPDETPAAPRRKTAEELVTFVPSHATEATPAQT